MSPIGSKTRCASSKWVPARSSCRWLKYLPARPPWNGPTRGTWTSAPTAICGLGVAPKLLTFTITGSGILIMARPLRIDIAGAWYHLMNRGHREEPSFAMTRRGVCGGALWRDPPGGSGPRDERFKISGGGAGHEAVWGKAGRRPGTSPVRPAKAAPIVNYLDATPCVFTTPSLRGVSEGYKQRCQCQEERGQFLILATAAWKDKLRGRPKGFLVISIDRRRTLSPTGRPRVAGYHPPPAPRLRRTGVTKRSDHQARSPWAVARAMR